MSYMSELHQSYHTVRERLYNPPKPNGHAPELVPLHPPAQYNDDRISGLLARIEEQDKRIKMLEDKIAELLADDNRPEPNNELPRIMAKDVMNLVIERENVRPSEMQAGFRKIKPTRARQIFCYLARYNTNASLPVIARFVNKDHTTVMHAIARIEELCKIDPALNSRVKGYELTLREQAAKNQRSHQEQVPVAPKDGP